MVTVESMREALDREGEIHVILEEHDKELELRREQAYIGDDTIIVETKTTEYHVGVDRVVSFYTPQEIWH